MIKRAGGQIIKGKTYYWTNWFWDQIYLEQPLFKMPDVVMPLDLLEGMFDEHSAYLMPMPMEVFN